MGGIQKKLGRHAARECLSLICPLYSGEDQCILQTRWLVKFLLCSYGYKTVWSRVRGGNGRVM